MILNEKRHRLRQSTLNECSSERSQKAFRKFSVVASSYHKLTAFTFNGLNSTRCTKPELHLNRFKSMNSNPTKKLTEPFSQDFVHNQVTASAVVISAVKTLKPLPMIDEFALSVLNYIAEKMEQIVFSKFFSDDS